MLLTGAIANYTSDRTLAPATDPCTDGPADTWQQWGMQQVAAWLAEAGLAALRPVFAEHRIAGDVLVDMNVGVVAALFKLPGSQKSTLKRELERLRASQRT